jgi:DNA-binding transcriptional LysR family regulator
MDLSLSTVSHHLRQLEQALGIDLMNHSVRPMVLTAQGALFLPYVEQALDLLNTGCQELSVIDPHAQRQLRFAMIEDFDSDIGPDIAAMLAKALPSCRFTHYTRVSHDILEMLRNRRLDLAVASRPLSPLPDVREIPLLRDPFVLAVPMGTDQKPEHFISGQSTLPFLRYNHSQIIGALIEAQLNRLQIKLENSFELDSTSSIMALVAQGNGWSITTPATYLRAKRFHPQLRLLPFPRRDFSRTISVFVAKWQAPGVANLVSSSMRNLMAAVIVAPLCEKYPWLKDRLQLIPEDRPNP